MKMPYNTNSPVNAAAVVCGVYLPAQENQCIIKINNYKGTNEKPII